jgi:formate hydrogenlyase transcriptional activator
LGTYDTTHLPIEQSAILRAVTSHLVLVSQTFHQWNTTRKHSLQLEETLKERTAQHNRRIEEQRVVLEAQRAASTNPNSEALFTAIADVIGRIVPFDCMAIVLPDLDDKKFLVYMIEVQKGRLHCYPGATFPYAGTVTAWVLKHKKPSMTQALHDLQPFPSCFDGHAKAGLQSHCALPLMVGNQAVGVLILAAKSPDQYNILDLPFLEEISGIIAVALDDRIVDEGTLGLKEPIVAEKSDTRGEGKPVNVFEEIIGKSQAIQKVLNRATMVAGTDSSVLISGETGTGKELIARAIYHLSRRSEKPFVTVNCAALPAGLIESELFGHEKGAFTGAIFRKIGRFELADGGTIFLDEIGDLSPEIQAKLLRVLQYREFERVGSSETMKVDVRLIAATNRRLTEAMGNNDFRADLYYRLNVFPIFLPPLRERREDIPLLTWYFLEKYTKRMQKPIPKINQKTMGRLMSYSWPGNIRELESVIERAVISSQGPILEVEDRLGSPSHKTVSKEERDHLLEEVLRQVGGNQSKAAKLLGIGRTTVWRKLKAQRNSNKINRIGNKAYSL